jgi:hypothetical protein
MKLSLPPKLVENLVWVPVISISKIFIPSYMIEALLCQQNWPFSPPNRGTSWIITLLCIQTSEIRYETRRAYGFKGICEYITWQLLVIIKKSFKIKESCKQVLIVSTCFWWLNPHSSLLGLLWTRHTLTFLEEIKYDHNL